MGNSLHREGRADSSSLRPFFGSWRSGTTQPRLYSGVRQALEGDGKGRSLGELLDMDDARGLFGGAAPGNAVSDGKRHVQSLARRIDAIGDEAETIRGDIDGHGFFEPGYAFGTHTDWDGERTAAGCRSE